MKTEKPHRPETKAIYTTGAKCEPMEFTNPANGIKCWRWVVWGFEDDSYSLDDGKRVAPTERAKTKEKLMRVEGDEDDFPELSGR